MDHIFRQGENPFSEFFWVCSSTLEFDIMNRKLWQMSQIYQVFSLDYWQHISTVWLRLSKWHRSKRGRARAQASINTRGNMNGWKNRNRLSNMSLLSPVKMDTVPRITGCHPAGWASATHSGSFSPVPTVCKLPQGDCQSATLVCTAPVFPNHISAFSILSLGTGTDYYYEITSKQIHLFVFSPFLYRNMQMPICSPPFLKWKTVWALGQTFHSLTSACRPKWCKQVPITFPY